MANETEALRVKITQEFVTRWAAADTAIPVEYENTEATGEQEGTWARFILILGDRKAAAVGTRHRRLNGLLALQVFIPREFGTRDGNVAFDGLAGAFDFQQIQVTLDDAAHADEIFSILMGEDVEQRRSFIQRNAKDVRFLDI